MRMLDESGDAAAVLHRRTSAFKVIPRIPEGSWVVKQAVGSTPVLLGNKLTTQFHRYFLSCCWSCTPTWVSKSAEDCSLSLHAAAMLDA